jgi:hypothetical protein
MIPSFTHQHSKLIPWLGIVAERGYREVQYDVHLFWLEAEH